MTLGPNVVYVVRRGDDHRGGVFHQPGETTDRFFTTRCGVRIAHATLMQREWAEHTDAERCGECFPVVYGVCEWCGGARGVESTRDPDGGVALRLVCTRCGREAT